MITTDYHVHSCYSSDSKTSIKDIIEAAIEKGFDSICITDHHDIDFPINDEGMDFQLDIASYVSAIADYKEQYKEKIEIRMGIEMGLMSHIAQEVNACVNAYPFDFVIGSSHLVNKVDPYYPEYYEGRTEAQSYTAYFESILENAINIKDYDVYGHLDYVVRYGPTKNKNFKYTDYSDIFEAILKQLISDGKGIEINTAGLYQNLGYPHPHIDILKRYKELGGEIITIGSDAHITERIGYGFDVAAEHLKNAGFQYYTIFKNRKPEFLML